MDHSGIPGGDGIDQYGSLSPYHRAKARHKAKRWARSRAGRAALLGQAEHLLTPSELDEHRAEIDALKKTLDGSPARG